jgi:hypothetical protein
MAWPIWHPLRAAGGYDPENGRQFMTPRRASRDSATAIRHASDDTILAQGARMLTDISTALLNREIAAMVFLPWLSRYTQEVRAVGKREELESILGTPGLAKQAKATIRAWTLSPPDAADIPDDHAKGLAGGERGRRRPQGPVIARSREDSKSRHKQQKERYNFDGAPRRNDSDGLRCRSLSSTIDIQTGAAIHGCRYSPEYFISDFSILPDLLQCHFRTD